MRPILRRVLVAGAAGLLAVAAAPAFAEVVETGSGQRVDDSELWFCLDWGKSSANSETSVELCAQRGNDRLTIDATRSVSTTEAEPGGEHTVTETLHWHGDADPSALVYNRETGSGTLQADVVPQCSVNVSFDSERMFDFGGESLPEPWLEHREVRLQSEYERDEMRWASGRGGVCGWPESQEVGNGIMRDYEQGANYTYVRPDWGATNACADGPIGRVEAGECPPAEGAGEAG